MGMGAELGLNTVLETEEVLLVHLAKIGVFVLFGFNHDDSQVVKFTFKSCEAL